MKPVPIDVRLPSLSGVAARRPPSTSPRTCTTAARARSARSANADAEIAGLCRGALVHSARLALGGGRRDPAAATDERQRCRRRRRRRSCGASTKLTPSAGGADERQCAALSSKYLSWRCSDDDSRSCGAPASRAIGGGRVARLVVLAADAVADVVDQRPGRPGACRRPAPATPWSARWRAGARTACASRACTVMPNQANASRATRDDAQLQQSEHAPLSAGSGSRARRTIWPEAGTSSRARSRRCNPATMPRLEPEAPSTIALGSDRARSALENSPSMEDFPSWASRRSRQIFF